MSATLSGAAVAALLGVSRKTLYRWHYEGRLFVHEWTPAAIDARRHLLTKRPRGPQRNPMSKRYHEGRHTFRPEGRIG